MCECRDSTCKVYLVFSIKWRCNFKTENERVCQNSVCITFDIWKRLIENRLQSAVRYKDVIYFILINISRYGENKRERSLESKCLYGEIDTSDVYAYKYIELAFSAPRVFIDHDCSIPHPHSFFATLHISMYMCLLCAHYIENTIVPMYTFLRSACCDDIYHFPDTAVFHFLSISSCLCHFSLLYLLKFYYVTTTINAIVFHEHSVFLCHSLFETALCAFIMRTTPFPRKLSRV